MNFGNWIFQSQNSQFRAKLFLTRDCLLDELLLRFLTSVSSEVFGPDSSDDFDPDLSEDFEPDFLVVPARLFS